jgi:hypothetical protein
MGELRLIVLHLVKNARLDATIAMTAVADKPIDGVP